MCQVKLLCLDLTFWLLLNLHIPELIISHQYTCKATDDTCANKSQLFVDEDSAFVFVFADLLRLCC
jgi:hypothetical protein